MLCGSSKLHSLRAGGARQLHSAAATQVTPCASPNPSDDQSFETDAATQREGLDLIAHITTAWVRAFNDGDAASREFLAGLRNSARVSAERTAPGCGFAVHGAEQ
jgi:hypothetical protein